MQAFMVYSYDNKGTSYDTFVKDSLINKQNI